MLVAKTSLALSVLTLFLASQTVKVDVNLINVFVTVHDEAGKPVAGLTRDDFVVYDDDQPQAISVFEKDEAVHSSIAVLMDTSGSMVDILPFMNRGVRDFAQTILHPDEYYVMTFGTSVRMIHRSPQTVVHLDQVLKELKPYGTSVLFDAMQYGMDRVQTSENQRKALVVFTDGYDNGSKLNYGRVARDAQASGALLYFVAIGSKILVDTQTLESLASVSGGRTFYVPKSDSVSPYLARIRDELSRQYYLGYYTGRRSGLHHIRVETPNQKGLTLHARTAYWGG